MVRLQTLRVVAALAGLVALAGSGYAQTAQQANVIENTVALQVARDACGYKVNNTMLALVLDQANIRTTDLTSGGKFSSTVQRNQARVRKLIASESGKASFCRTVRNELSAMLD